jgi:hydrogenase-4 component E
MINALIGFFIAILISALFTTRLYRLFFWYALNSLMLGSIAIILGLKIADDAMVTTGIITIIIKFLLIPYILKYITKKFNIDRKAPPTFTIQYSTIIVPIILVFTFYLVSPMLDSFGGNSNYVAIAISSLFLSHNREKNSEYQKANFRGTIPRYYQGPGIFGRVKPHLEGVD